MNPRSLESSQVCLLEPGSSLILAKQIAAAKREAEGARVAVKAAELYDANGNKKDAQPLLLF